MSKIIKVIVGVIVLLISLVLLTFSYYVFQLSPTSSDKKVMQIEIPKGTTGDGIANILKNNGLIRDTTVFKIYLKVHNVKNINYGIYELNKAMGVKQIADIIGGRNAKSADIKILFKEGQNMRGIAKAIASYTNNSEADVFALLKDEEYIDSLISEYWFLSDTIKDKDIYYPLEGYLAPNTYQFASKAVTVKEILKRMLDQTDTVLTPYKDKMNNYTIHEYLTLASIVENEGINDEDRAKIASVFYNRLDINMKLGSCVTACYAAKLDLCVPKNVNISIVSPYNTYLASMAGKLPIGPVSNPGVASIEATINPANTYYLYFLSDTDKTTYFFKTYPEHQAKEAQLKAAGLWVD